MKQFLSTKEGAFEEKIKFPSFEQSELERKGFLLKVKPDIIWEVNQCRGRYQEGYT